MSEEKTDLIISSDVVAAVVFIRYFLRINFNNIEIFTKAIIVSNKWDLFSYSRLDILCKKYKQEGGKSKCYASLRIVSYHNRVYDLRSMCAKRTSHLRIDDKWIANYIKYRLLNTTTKIATKIAATKTIRKKPTDRPTNQQHTLYATQ